MSFIPIVHMLHLVLLLKKRKTKNQKKPPQETDGYLAQYLTITSTEGPTKFLY